APGDDLVEAGVGLLFGFGLVLVGGLGAAEAFDGDVLLCGLAEHDDGGLFLAGEFAGVGDGGEHGEVFDPVGAVVPVPEGLLVVGGCGDVVGFELEELAGLGEAGAGGGGGPEVGVVG